MVTGCMRGKCARAGMETTEDGRLERRAGGEVKALAGQRRCGQVGLARFANRRLYSQMER